MKIIVYVQQALVRIKDFKGYLLSQNVDLKEFDITVATFINDTGVKNIFKHMANISKLLKLKRIDSLIMQQMI